MDWNLFRLEFPVAHHWAYFDHAAVAPLTGRAARALIAWANDQADHGVAHWSDWQRKIERVRGLAGKLLNVDPLDIAFVKNTSEGVGIVAEGFPWQPGDNVVLPAEEYPANQYPWLNLASRGVEVRRVPSRGPRVELDDLRTALDGRTRVLSVSFVEFASGFRNDLAAISQLCRERGIALFVDAIQGLGVFPLDLQQIPVDFLAADGHKWLLGPEGAGLLYVRREWIDRLRPVGVGWNSVVDARDFSTIDYRLKPHAGRYESGSLNEGTIVALGASLELLLQSGIPALEARVLELTDRLCEGVRRIDREVFSSRRSGEASGIVAVMPRPGVDPVAEVRHCRSQGVVINQRGGRVRVSPHAYNTADEIDHLVALLGGRP
jgi:selenocysteine lyase/cysteine desulfurase